MKEHFTKDQCEEIVYAFIDCVADDPPLIGDCSLLPYPKSVILYALGEMLNHYERQQETISDPDLRKPYDDIIPKMQHLANTLIHQWHDIDPEDKDAVVALNRLGSFPAWALTLRQKYLNDEKASNEAFDSALRRMNRRAPENATSSRTMKSWVSRKPTQQKYVEAAIKVGSNLYLHTIPGGEHATAPLHFTLPDSRYRYMIFCLSATISAALAYDEEKKVQLEALIDGCLHFATWTATEMAQEYFDDAACVQDSVGSTTAYLTEFSKHWSQWPKLQKEGKNAESRDLICSMIHSTESNEPVREADLQRLEPLALWINCRLPTMWEAFIELANR